MSKLEPELNSELEALLQQGLAEMDLSLPAHSQQQLLDYVVLLSKWNKTYNLTAIRDIRQMVRRHLLDSLSINRFIDSTSVLDVGAGAGLPGIPLAVANPHVNVTLIDSVAKKTRFMQFAAAELGLKNIEVQHGRVEMMESKPGFGIVVARAFSSLEKLCSVTSHLIAPGGKILAMIGRPLDGDNVLSTSADPGPHSSLPNELDGFTVVKTDKLFVPGETAERNIVVLQHSVS